jgi:hypothetical protein
VLVDERPQLSQPRADLYTDAIQQLSHASLLGRDRTALSVDI